MDIFSKIVKLNLDLNQMLVSSVSSENYKKIILKVFKANSYIEYIEFVNSIEDFNHQIESIGDIKRISEFYEKVDGDMENVLCVREFGNDLYFIKSEEFNEFVETVISSLPLEETMSFNNYIIRKLYDDEIIEWID